MFDWLKLGVGALAGAGIAFAAGYMVGNSHGRQRAIASPSSRTENRLMKRQLLLMTRLFVICSAAASCQTAKVTDPCDVLVAINPKPETNS